MIEVKNVVKTTSKITKITKKSAEPVYDITVRDTHRINADGFYTSNCNHPDVEQFITIKQDRKRVTGANVSVRVTDEFMNAVADNQQYTLRWPIESTVENAKLTVNVNAKDIWDKMMFAAWDSAEPGVIYWDTVINNSMADEFADKGYKTVCTNPCLTGDTRVAVADGRGFVEFRQLAEEGRDVKVYSRNEETGKLEIKTMRNPHRTKQNVPVYEVTIEGGFTFKATGDHKIPLHSGIKQVIELVPGDQLFIANRKLKRINEKTTNKAPYVYWQRGGNFHQSEHRMVYESVHGTIPNGYVIHHIDFNSMNNSIDNLCAMKQADHVELHAARMRGELNPIHKVLIDEKRCKEWKEKLSIVSSGLSNANACDISNEHLHEHIRILTKKLNRRVSKSDWYTYAKINKLPASLNKFRAQPFKTPALLLKEIAIECGIETELINKRKNLSERIVHELKEANIQGYKVKIGNCCVEVLLTCEYCNKQYWIDYRNRGVTACSISCRNSYSWHNAKKREIWDQRAKKSGEKSKNDILNVYTHLRYTLNRTPTQKEVIKELKRIGMKYSTRTKHGFANFSAVKKEAESFNHRVLSVKLVGNEDVYNGSVDDNHNFMIGGWKTDDGKELCINVLNCSELPLSANDSCRLLLLNLISYVSDPFTKNAKFDYKKFEDHSMKAQRLMDDLVDLELEAIEKIIAKIESDPEKEQEKYRELMLWNKIKLACANGRRTGTGVTALGDALAALSIRYGSEESIKVTEEIYKTLAIATHSSSVIMAQERGAFPAWEPERYQNNEFAKRLIAASDKNIQKVFATRGRRNIALTTTAPAGSVSTLTRTTSGIEPAYLLHYTRRKKLNDQEINEGSTIDFIDKLGDRWQEYSVFHPGFKLWSDITGLKNIEDSPYHKSTSNDVDWVASVDLLAAAQKWTEHSISKTINLPKDTTVDLISDVYFRAWKLGIKGVTVYRDGCRDGVLINSETPSQIQEVQLSEIAETHAPKRLKELKCDIHRVSVKGELYLVIVGLLNDKPYEVFAGLSEHVEVPKKVKSGTLIKNGKVSGLATYNLKIPYGDDDDMTFKNVVNLFDNPLYGAFTRTISLALRHGVPVQYLVEQLRKDKHSDMTSFSAVIARVLSKHYIPDGTNASTSEKACSACGSNLLSYQQGCVTCMNCSASKCG